MVNCESRVVCLSGINSQLSPLISQLCVYLGSAKAQMNTLTLTLSLCRERRLEIWADYFGLFVKKGEPSSVSENCIIVTWALPYRDIMYSTYSTVSGIAGTRPSRFTVAGPA